MKRFLLAAMLLMVSSSALAVVALPAKAELAGECNKPWCIPPGPSTSCGTLPNGDACVTTPTGVCVSDRPTCPKPTPVCWYEGEEPLDIKYVSCHRPEPPPDPTPTYGGVCILDSVLCIGGECQEGGCQFCDPVHDAINICKLQGTVCTKVPALCPPPTLGDEVVVAGRL